MRMTLEGFSFEMQERQEGFAVIVKSCPWHDIMVKSGRESLSDRVSDLICLVENSTWASEFDSDAEKGTQSSIKFDREQRICRNEGRCVLCFGDKIFALFSGGGGKGSVLPSKLCYIMPR